MSVRATAISFALLIAACSDGGGARQSPAFSVQAVFRGNDNPAVPQAGILELETEVEADLFVKVAGGGEQWSLARPAATKFREPIVGLKPDTRYALSAILKTEEASVYAGPLVWSTPPLPIDFPPMDVAISDAAQMEPGLTEFNPWVGVNEDDDFRAPLVMVDHEGVVRWYYEGYRVFDDHRRLSNGNFLFTPDQCVLVEVDVLGHLVRSWYSANHPVQCEVPEGSVPVPIDSVHHEMTMLPNGDLLVLSTEARWVDHFPTSEDDPDAPTERAYVVGCVIVQFTAAGEIVKRISLMDLLDPTRIGRNSLMEAYPWEVALYYGEREGVPAHDWDHANALVYEESSDSYYVSLRHQDAVIKVRRSDESLTWILGTPSNWRSPWTERLLSPVGSLEWPYHQHAVQVTADGIGMYDNGNYRAAAYETPGTEYSRAVLYAVDEEAMTVEQRRSYGEPSGADSFFSSAMGSAEWLPSTGNVLLANAVLATKPFDRVYAQVLEVAPDGTRLFELNVRGKAGSMYLMHRGRRVPDLRQ
ncbi:MAG: aryl-sulfate sulfotransferase [Polyangiaceae bacterium]|nr:aryl-sulfate sulfotransferase [Polyangiaceae bacterium]